MHDKEYTRRNWMVLAGGGAYLTAAGCCGTIERSISSEQSDRDFSQRAGNLIGVREAQKEIARLKRDLQACRLGFALLGFPVNSSAAMGVLAEGAAQPAAFDETPLGSGTAVAAATGPSPDNPAGTRSYLLDILGEEQLLVYDDLADALIGRIALGSSGTGGALHRSNEGLAVTSDGLSIVTTGWGDPPHIAFLDAKTRTLRGRLPLPTGLFPSVVAAAPDSRRVYVAAIEGTAAFVATGGLLLEVDIADMAILRRIPLPGVPNSGISNYRDIAVSPDGGQIFLLDQAARGMQILDVRSGTLAASVPITGGPRRLSVHPDGDRVYAFPAFVGGSFDFDGVWEISTAIAAKTGEIVLPMRSTRGNAFGLAIAPAGETLFASALDYPAVWHIDTYSGEVSGRTDFGTEVTHIFIG